MAIKWDAKGGRTNYRLYVVITWKYSYQHARANTERSTLLRSYFINVDHFCYNFYIFPSLDYFFCIHINIILLFNIGLLIKHIDKIKFPYGNHRWNTDEVGYCQRMHSFVSQLTYRYIIHQQVLASKGLNIQGVMGITLIP